MAPNQQRVLVVVARRVYRQGLCQLLTTLPDVEVAGEAEDGRTAVSLAGELRPDITILEIDLPALNGVDATRQLVAECPGMAVIAISPAVDWVTLTGVLRAGAQAYVLADGGFDEIEQAIRAVSNGHVFLSPGAEARVIKSLDRVSAAAPVTVLTPREREVLQLIAEGNSTKKTAEILTVSAKTVESHRRQIMRKLGIYSVAGLTKYAIRNGITSLA